MTYGSSYRRSWLMEVDVYSEIYKQSIVHLLRMMTPARKIQALNRMIRLLTPNTNTSENIFISSGSNKKIQSCVLH